MTATSTAVRTKVRQGSGDGRALPALRTYRQALAYLDSLTNLERLAGVRRLRFSQGLANITKLLGALGNPHKRLRCVHVAGTKGKGSTCTMLASMLQANKLVTGLYTSPHVSDVRERIAINGSKVSESEFTRLIARVARAAADARLAKAPSFFEVMTAAAFTHFSDRKVDLAVIETGLGGRLDCTNVLPKPLACGITSISYDHTDLLGKTLGLIAEEKAGIFKPGVPVISAPQVGEVKRVLKKAAERVKAPLHFAGDEIEFSYRFERSRASGPNTRVSVLTPTSRFEHMAVPLPGEHQAINCGLALGLLDALRAQGLSINDEAATAGLAAVKLEGRMELISEEPRILVDGAHNAASIEALMRAIGQNVSYDSMVVIFGCNSDKDVDGMLQHIQLGADKIIFTTSGSPRACPPSELATRFAEVSGRMAQVEPNLSAALQTAAKPVTRDDLICITGSFVLVGEAKSLMSQPEFVRTLRR